MKRQFRLPSLLLPVLGSIMIAIGGCAMNSPIMIVAPQPAPLAMAVRLCDSAALGCVNTTNFSLASMRIDVNVDWQNVLVGHTHNS